MTLYTIATLALAFATFSDLADAHIKLASPVPYGKATLDTSPLKDAKPGSPGSDFPCKQRSGVYDLTERTQIVAGADNPLTFDGSATHGGGSGFLAVTTDEHPDVNSQWKTFMVFDSGMPVKGDSESGSGTSSYTYALPKGMLNGNLTLGWYWYNRIGNRELYSNCAPLEITGGSEDRGVFDALPNAYLINLPTSECSSQEMGDTEIPNPSNAVVVKGGGTSMLAATGPSCAASAAAVTKGLSGGSGSGPATSAASPTSAPSAPSASAPASYGSSPLSNMTSAAANPVSSPSGGEIGNSASGSAPTSFLTISSAAATQPAASSAHPTMTPSSAGISAPTGYPAAANGSSSGSSSSSSGSSSSDGISCSSDGKQYGQVVAGSTVWRNVAAGTSCSNGQIVKRSLMRHAHVRRAGHV